MQCVLQLGQSLEVSLWTAWILWERRDGDFSPSPPEWMFMDCWSQYQVIYSSLAIYSHLLLISEPRVATMNHRCRWGGWGMDHTLHLCLILLSFVLDSQFCVLVFIIHAFISFCLSLCKNPPDWMHFEKNKPLKGNFTTSGLWTLSLSLSTTDLFIELMVTSKQNCVEILE